MNGFDQVNKDRLLYLHNHCRDEFVPAHVIFNTSLQEFARRVEMICGLQAGGKITADAAYEQIHQLYQQLRKSREVLGVD
ncbi:DUF7219 family protein [Egbenema bharatensis]|uniref:DUF7219 family protein n=1 Tax=Egbenema bharatensis TaxID=3463334 RepID=UPI003A8548AE